jgi:hypothetical protein
MRSIIAFGRHLLVLDDDWLPNPFKTQNSWLLRVSLS